MRIELKLLTVALVTLVLTGCATKHADIVVADFDGNKITMDEFEKAYAKNVGGIEQAKKDSLDDYKKFLDLYVNYRMKLRDAFVRDYRDDEELQNEFEDYKNKVGTSFLEENKVIKPGVKKLYNERKEEIRASHIMLRKGNNPDSTRQFLQTVLDSIKSGQKSFEDMVLKYSQDNFSKRDSGDIYWFTAGQIVPSFEEAAYATEVGSVYPKVVETKFGFHIIKVTDRQNRKYKIRAKHILLKAIGREVATDSTETPLQRITKIREEIINGADFDSLAKKYSDDKGSGAKGGDLGFFERRMMVKPFDEAVFKLKVGELSDIIKTRFGYHIIKLTDVKKYPSYNKEVDNIRKIYKKARYEYDMKNYLDGLKKKYKYSLNKKLLEEMGNNENRITLAPNYGEDEKFIKVKDSVIVTLGAEKYTVADLFAYLFTQSKYENTVLSQRMLSDGVNEFTKDLLLKKEVENLEQTNKEFANLMKDYRDGIYIFKLQEDEVWNKVKIDTAAIREIYLQKKDSLIVEAKVAFTEIFSKDKSKIEKYYQDLQNGADFDTLAAKHTERPGYKRKNGKYELVDVSSSELAEKANALKNVGDYSEPFEVKGGWSIVRLDERLEARIQTFEEALPQLASEYQDAETKRLENEYVNSLKEFYQPEYFYDELENAYKSKNK
jgi:peptidyl-prolyl cis-trans isomerase SurA